MAKIESFNSSEKVKIGPASTFAPGDVLIDSLGTISVRTPEYVIRFERAVGYPVIIPIASSLGNYQLAPAGSYVTIKN